MGKDNCYIGKQYKKVEKFSAKKFMKGMNVLSPIWWAKTTNSLFRMLIIAGIVFAIIFGSGYWQGLKRKPVILGYKDFVAYITRDSEEHKLEVKKGMLYFDDKVVRVSDVPQLKPFGIKIRPKLFAGVGSGIEGELGLGAEVFHYFKWNLDVFGTNKGAYVGISYDMELAEWMRNSSAGFAIGKAWENLEDTRFIFYWSIRF